MWGGLTSAERSSVPTNCALRPCAFGSRSGSSVGPAAGVGVGVGVPAPSGTVDGEEAVRPCTRTPDSRARSEEHTPELQSLMRISYAVFCLKKKNKTKEHNQDHNAK